MVTALNASGDASVLTAGQRADLEDLRQCATYLYRKVCSLREQYEAQIAIEMSAFSEAQAHLQEACRLEREVTGASLADCEHWLAVVSEEVHRQSEQ